MSDLASTHGMEARLLHTLCSECGTRLWFVRREIGGYVVRLLFCVLCD
jgi:ribosomal protein L37E